MAERICLDGHEWRVASALKNEQPYGWLPRLRVHLPPLIGYISSCEIGNARCGKGEALKECPESLLAENAANARLIAAAPELLASLESVIAEADRDTVAFIAAREVIAKAKGETP